MTELFRSSLFLYEIEESSEPTPIIVFWRATVFRFNEKVSKSLLKRLLGEFAASELIEPQERLVAWEKNRQVEFQECKGVGVNWIEVSRGVKQKGKVTPEKRVAIVNYSAYENLRVRLGYSEFLRKASAYGRAKRAASVKVGLFESFWSWITSHI